MNERVRDEKERMRAERERERVSKMVELSSGRGNITEL